MDYLSSSSFCNIHTEQDYGIGGASSIVDVLGNDAKANLQERDTGIEVLDTF